METSVIPRLIFLRLENCLGYETAGQFEEGLSRTYEWYRATQTRAPAKTEK